MVGILIKHWENFTFYMSVEGKGRGASKALPSCADITSAFIKFSTRMRVNLVPYPNYITVRKTPFVLNG
jgi:hypothetical protein